MRRPTGSISNCVAVPTIIRRPKNEKVYAGGNTSPRGLYNEGSETFYENNYSFLATARKDNLLDRLGGFVTFGGNLMMQQRTKMNASGW